MDKTALVDSDIDNGLTAIRVLEAAGLPIAAAMWLRLKDTNTWQLFIASPDVEKHGPTTVIRFVDSVLATIKSSVSIHDIAVVNTTNHFVNALAAQGFGRLPWERQNGFLRLTNLTLDGANVEDALVYKIAPNVKASKSPPKPDETTLKKATLAA